MEKLVCEKLFDNQVWKVVLNHPKANVVDSAMLREFQSLFDELSTERHCKLIILQGAGKHFSFGVSVKEHTEAFAAEMLDLFHGFFIRLSDLAVPVCSLISGQCLGGGLEMASFAHFVFADETARLGQPEINLAVFAPPASFMLPLKIGHTAAEDMLLTGRTLDAHKAKAMGLVTHVFPDRETMETKVGGWIQEHILPKSAFALKVAVRAVRRDFNARLKEHLDAYKALYLNETMASHDGKEGLDSFLEKRKPVWKDV
jgi:cyclohexa-1,5-dienecarbonyl-CoA hydratase